MDKNLHHLSPEMMQKKKALAGLNLQGLDYEYYIAEALGCTRTFLVVVFFADVACVATALSASGSHATSETVSNFSKVSVVASQ